MSIFKALSRMFSSNQPKSSSAAPKAHRAKTKAASACDLRLIGSKGDGIKLVGTSKFQSEITRHAGHLGEYGARKTVRIQLVEEENNSHDPNAVRAEIAGRTVAFLPAEKAEEYRSQLRAAGFSGKKSEASAKIIGGFETEEGRALLGVRILCEWPLKFQAKKQS